MSRILLVDDEKDLVTLIGYVLKKDGHEVDVAHDGVEAMEKVAPGQALPDMIVLDVMMPRMDGHAVYQKLHDDPRTKMIPVVILTAKGSTWEMFKDGSTLSAFLEKPFDPQYLREHIRGTLAKLKSGA